MDLASNPSFADLASNPKFMELARNPKFADLAKTMDTSDEWITSRTGIKTRHITTDEETTALLATEAAKKQ